MEGEKKPWRAFRKYPRRSTTYHHQNYNNCGRGGRATGNSFRDGRKSPYPTHCRRRQPFIEGRNQALIESRNRPDSNAEECEYPNFVPIRRWRGPSRPPSTGRKLEEAEKARNDRIIGSSRVEHQNNQMFENPERERTYQCMRRCLIELNSRHNEYVKNIDRVEEENEDIRRRLTSMETEVCKINSRLQVLELHGNATPAASSESSIPRGWNSTLVSSHKTILEEGEGRRISARVGGATHDFATSL